MYSEETFKNLSKNIKTTMKMQLFSTLFNCFYHEVIQNINSNNDFEAKTIESNKEKQIIQVELQKINLTNHY